MQLAHISVSDFDNNCYLLHEGTEALLIDAADNAPALMKLAADNGVTITKVLTTHRHHDHVRALDEILKTTGATHYASSLDAPNIPAKVDVELNDGDSITLADNQLPVTILRGHTEGGVCLAVELDGVINLFLGDSLFPGGLGKTESPADFEQLFHDVTTKVFNQFPDNTIVWPGHGEPTTLGAERDFLPQWWERKW